MYCLLLLSFPNPFSLLQSRWDSFIQQAMEARTQLSSELKKVTTMGCLACSGMPPKMSMPSPFTIYYKRNLIHQRVRIKKAYRRKAFELHPDRNYGNTETTELFAELQSAYEVLSDPQERAWYDSHREVFLGRDAEGGHDDYSYNTRMTTSDDIYKIFTSFSPRMEFSDSESGFYGGLRETFSRLAWEEKMACQWENIEFRDYPTFGSRNDGFEDTARPFYAAWSSFSTKKSFAWKDLYRYSKAPDRRVRRMMEKENKRLREEGIRDFNDAVRSLVSFVKKRDLRYKPNPQSETQRQETLRQSAAAQATRSRAANQAKLREYVIPSWAKSEERFEDRDDSSETEVEHFDCVVCHKSFKSQQQFQSHERSKKHQQAVKKLCWEMTAQDKQLDLQAGGNDDNVPKGAYNEQVGEQSVESVTRLEDESLGESAADDVHTGTQRLASDDQSGSAMLGLSSSGTGSATRENAQIPLHGWDISSQEKLESQDAIDTLSQQLSLSGMKEPTGKMGKAKQKRARKAAQELNQLPELTCTSCHSSFTSRSQLFSHIRESNHAQSLPTVSREGKGRLKYKT